MQIQYVLGTRRARELVARNAIDGDRNVHAVGIDVPLIAVDRVRRPLERDRDRAVGRLRAHVFEDRRAVLVPQRGDRRIAAEGARERAFDDHALDRVVRGGRKGDEERDDTAGDERDASQRDPREAAPR